MHQELETTHERFSSKNKGPSGSVDTFEGSMCGITHTWRDSCMACIHIMDPKNEIIQNQRVVKNE